MSQTEEVGILGYGVYIPRFRIKVEEVARIWGQPGDVVRKALGVEEKSIPDMDEDTITISVEASRNALKMADILPEDIEAVYVGSESHPYAVKPSATIVSEAVGATPITTAADLEFACKAGTAGVQMCLGLVKSKIINIGLAVGADCSQGRPGDALEYTASAGACALIIGSYNIIASIDHTESFTTDTPDFWRREGATYPSHGGRFTGEPAYFKHVTRAAENIMQNTNTTPDDYDYVIFHEPNSKFPLATAKKLGFPKEKVAPSLAVRYIGNTYSASSMIGLAAVLDIAKAGDKILMISYGSGSGSDAFTMTVKDGIEERRKGIPTVQDYIDDKVFLDYSYYTKHRGKIKM
ncbi:MAG: hydroxymethylglutaryl-CoA synthase [Candidatus Heimdallarchaeota archaeon]|nr:MAG: hydroxymethylglutaryl-CoA synthase [Candidatus Heimdallarchaeota archaeon]